MKKRFFFGLHDFEIWSFRVILPLQAAKDKLVLRE